MKKHSAKKTVPEAVNPQNTPQDFEQEVSRRAYELWLEGGCCHGQDSAHWLQAEREVREARQAKGG